jgi:2-phosphosulfolactate phosphatase
MIDVAFTRAEIRRADVAVVLDVLRATSTATQALASGYRRVICADSIERAGELRGPGRMLAGERGCVRPAGFDQGNSPVEARSCHGDELVLATTNGAPTIVATAGAAEHVFLGCLLNLDAVLATLEELAHRGLGDVQLVCSGTGGAIAIEDVYAAGLICERWRGPLTDAAVVAVRLAESFETPLRALHASANARALKAVGLTSDIAYCAIESELDVVPLVVEAGAGFAVAVAGDRVAETGELTRIDATATVTV